MAGRYLVAGGAGFIGSHLVAGLLERGDECVVFDNLQTGHREAVMPGARFVLGDLSDAAALDAVLSQGVWDGVFHLADLSLVGESMREPLRYLTVNPGNAGRLISACIRHSIPRLVFSSTANLFGTAGEGPIDEDAPISPGSPYGEGKRTTERMLYWADQVHGLRSACLRFFNAAGADPQGRFGEDHTPETHLIPLAIDAALGLRPPLTLFGDDYPTPDGTCIRDYIHVTDLVSAHLHALAQLEGRSVCYNLGLGQGYSVREVIESVSRVSGRKVPHVQAARRAGDPAILVASSARIMRETGWVPLFTSLDAIVETALSWRRDHPHGYGGTANSGRAQKG